MAKKNPAEGGIQYFILGVSVYLPTILKNGLMIPHSQFSQGKAIRFTGRTEGKNAAGLLPNWFMSKAIGLILKSNYDLNPNVKI